VKETKLTELLKSLSGREFRRLGDYVQSPYITVNPQLTSLHQLFSSRHPDYSHELTQKKILFKHLFPNQKYNDKKIRYLFTDYTRLIEDFLVSESLGRNEQIKEQVLRKELALRNCGKAYRLKTARKTSVSIQDADYFLHAYQTEYTHLDNWVSKQKRKQEENTESVIENLDKFYLSKKLELSCAVQNSRNVLALDSKNPFQEEIVSLLRSSDYINVPIIAIYHKILLTLTKDGDHRHFDELLKLLNEHGTDFSLRQLREIYQYAMN